MKGSNNGNGSNTNTSKIFGGGRLGGGGSGRHQQQNRPNAGNSLQGSSSGSNHQPKPNAWSKPLQSSNHGSRSGRGDGPPPGLGGRFGNGNNSRFGNGTTSNAAVGNFNGNNNYTGNTANGNAGYSPNSGNSSFSTDVALRERFIHLVTILTGQKVTVTLKSGTIVTGVLHTATPFAHLPSNQRYKYVLKAVTIDKEADGDATSIQIGQTLILDMSSVVHLHAKSIRLDQLVSTNGSGTGSGDPFATDTEISRVASKNGGAEDLIMAGSAWTSGESGKEMLLEAKPIISNNNNRTYNRSSSAEEMHINSRAAKLSGNTPTSLAQLAAQQSSATGVLKGSIAGWDQFKANEELFNVIGSYDENIYTTALDKSTLDSEKIARAEKLAKEIESTVSVNPHVAEERGQKQQIDNAEDELDEEDKYSGVLSASRLGSLISTSEPVVSAAAISGNTLSAATSKPKLNYAQAAKQVSSSKAGPTMSSVPPPGFVSKDRSTAGVAKPKEVQALESFKTQAKSTLITISEPISLGVVDDIKAETEIGESLETKNNSDVSNESKDETESVKAFQDEIEKKIDSLLLEDEKDAEETDTVNSALENKTVTKVMDENVNSNAEIPEAKQATKESESTDESKQEETAPSKSKLNVNAKEFTLNVGAKPFTPSTMMTSSAQPPSHQQPSPHQIAAMQQQHLHHPLHHTQYQPQYFDHMTGMTIPMHSVPPYGASGANMQPHHGPIPGSHQMIGAHHMLAAQPHHYQGQYQVIRAYPGQYGDPMVMQQQQHTAKQQPTPVPPTISSQSPIPPLPATNNASAASNASAATSRQTSGVTTPVPIEDGAEAVSQRPQEDGESTTKTLAQPLQPHVTTQPQIAHMQQQWQQPGGYYTNQMHMQQHQQRMGVPPGAYPPQQFMHHPSQMAAIQMRQHQMYAPAMVSGQPPPPMRGGTPGSAGGPNSVGSAGGIPYIPGPPSYMGGPYQPYSGHGIPSAGGVGMNSGFNNGSGEDDGQGGYGRGGRGGRGRGAGRGGRGRGAGRGRGNVPGAPGSGNNNNNRFNSYQDHGQGTVVSGSQSGSGRQTPQNPTTEGSSAAGVMEPAAKVTTTGSTLPVEDVSTVKFVVPAQSAVQSTDVPNVVTPSET